jgi:hypothetical protein
VSSCKAPKSCRRAASTSPEHHTSESAKRQSRHPGPSAVLDVASALREVAESFSSSVGDGPTTPERRTNAIRAVAKDRELDARERIGAIRLFKRDIAAADAYLAIDEPDVHAEFIRLEIEDI